MTTITDLYPTRGAAEVSTPRQDPVVWSQPGAAGPIGAQELRAFDRDGFLTVDKLVGPEEVDILLVLLDSRDSRST